MKARTFALILIALGFVVYLIAAYLFLFRATELDLSQQIKPTVFAGFGSFLAGAVGTLFSLAGVLLLIQNLHEQDRNFTRRQIEDRFFNLVRIHRENSDQISIGKRTGKRVYITLWREFHSAYITLHRISGHLNLDGRKLVNVAYLAFYFGVSGRSGNILRKRLEGELDEQKINLVIDTLKRHSIAIASVKSMREMGHENETDHDSAEEKLFPYKLFEGHQSRLGHYFRNLFQTVTYINKQSPSILTYQEKYEYIKHLRAQISTHEQVFLLLNSLSDLGKAWELGEQVTNLNDRLITKYNLITNIPDEFVPIISMRKHFPLVSYESDTEIANERVALEKKYS